MKYIGLNVQQFYSLLLKIISVILKFATILYLSKFFGHDIYGAFALVLSYFLLFTLLFRFGFEIFLQKQAAFSNTINQIEKHWIILFRLLFISVITTLASSLILVYSLPLFTQIDQIQYSFMVYLFPFSFLYSVAWLLAYFFRGIGKITFSIVVLEILFPVINMLMLFMLNFIEIMNNVILKISISYLVSIFAIVLVYCTYVKKEVSKLSIDKLYIKIIPTHIQANYYIVHSSPYLIIAISSMLLVNLDLYILDYFKTNGDVGIYSVITRIGSLLLLPASIAGIYFSNRIVQLVAKYQTSLVMIELHKSILVLFVFTTIGFLIINIFSDYILDFFGDNFKNEKIALLLFTIAQLIYSTTVGLDSTMLMTKLKKKYFLINLVGIVCIGISGCFLVPLYGIKGASLSVLISVVIIKMIQYWVVKREFTNV